MNTREVYLVKRLRTLSERPLTGSWYSSELKEAADAIEALTAANAELREALERIDKFVDAVQLKPTKELASIQHEARAALARKP